MKASLSDIVVTDGNRSAFERVMGLGDEGGESVRLFMHGPAGSGKTAVMSARGLGGEAGSKRRMLFTHAAELTTAIRLGTSERLLNDAGEAAVLLIDNFDAFYEEGIGLDVCRLLLAERNRRGLSTVVAARMPRDSYDLSKLDGVLDEFEDVAVEPLDADGRIEFARRRLKRYQSENEDAPSLSDEALAFVVNEFAGELREVDLALRFLATAAGFEANALVGPLEAQKALGAR